MIDLIGGPDRDRTGDLFHAMEARSQLRHRPTKEGTSFILLEDASSVKRSTCGNHPFTVVIRRKNVPIPPIRTCSSDLTHR